MYLSFFVRKHVLQNKCPSKNMIAISSIALVIFLTDIWLSHD